LNLPVPAGIPQAPFRRYLQYQVESDLARKMVFVGGPRQVGKTWLGKAVIADERAYLSYDIAPHRAAIFKRELPPTSAWFFDEIHKYRGWRNYLKGLYDQFGPRQRILVTGSARLDLYRFGGDSLQGRYFYLRLYPLSFAELGDATQGDLADLLALSGFPEPFFGASETAARRWSLVYRERLVREEVAALESVSDLGKLELLMLALPERVGSPLTVNSLREDLQVGHPTLSRWLDILARVYATFRVAPFGAPKLRAVKKARKHYHFDWTVVPDPGARFENLVASHLLKWAEYQVDTQGHRVELRCFRDVDGRELDFVLVHDGKPVGFVECETGDALVSSGLRYLTARFPGVPAWQISAAGKKDYVSAEGIRMCPAPVLLRQLA
jgi:hypothetical protein